MTPVIKLFMDDIGNNTLSFMLARKDVALVVCAADVLVLELKGKIHLTQAEMTMVDTMELLITNLEKQ